MDTLTLTLTLPAQSYPAPPEEMRLDENTAAGVYRRYAAGVRSLRDRALFSIHATIIGTWYDSQSYPYQIRCPSETLVVLDIGDDEDVVLDPAPRDDHARLACAQIYAIIAESGGGRLGVHLADQATARWVPAAEIIEPRLLVRSRERPEVSSFPLRPRDAQLLLQRAIESLTATYLRDVLPDLPDAD